MDLARALAEDLGVELRIESMAFQSLPTALNNGQIDLIFSGLTATADRAKTLLFTEPYYRTGLCLLVPRDSGIQSSDDLKAPGRRIAVKLGTTGDIVAQRMFPDAELVRFDTEGSCALEVVNGRVDAFIYDQLSIMRHQKNNPDTTRALLDPLTYEPYAIAIRQGDFVFWRYLNLFFDRVRGDGRFDAIYQKHFSELSDGTP
jgi:polar amino acid transport system substrate-binding protein